MRKIAAILLLLVFAFNLFGYRIVISLLQTKADQKLEAVIDNKEYNENELVEMRVSLNMPYQQRYTEFERHYGHINIDGKEYTYVERKIEGDMLILKCIPNNLKTQLKDIASNITEANSNSGSQNESPTKSSAKVFSFECDDMSSSAIILPENKKQMSFLQYADNLSENTPAVQLQPPRIAHC